MEAINVKKLIIIGLFFSLVFLLACNKTKRIDIIDKQFSYRENTYIPQENSSYFFNQNVYKVIIGWTRNLYGSRVEMYAYDQDVELNIIFIEGMIPSLWTKIDFVLPEIMGSNISKIELWNLEFPIDNADERILWSSGDSPIPLRDMVESCTLKEGSWDALYNLTLYLSDYPNLAYGGVSVAEKNDQLYMLGFHDQSCKIKPEMDDFFREP